MTYYESAEDTQITQKRAIQEVKSHGADINEFFEDLGHKTTYNAQSVLVWLGY